MTTTQLDFYIKDLLEKEPKMRLINNVWNYMAIENPFYDQKKYTLSIKMFTEVAVLKKNDNFGELALMNDSKPRAARVTCKKDSVFCTLLKEDF